MLHPKSVLYFLIQNLISMAAFMEVCNFWYGTATTTLAIWGAALMLARSRRHFRAIRARAGDAPRRLLYGLGVPHTLIDGELPSSKAVYALPSCAWRHFGLVMESLEMPHVPEMLLQPDER